MKLRDIILLCSALLVVGIVLIISAATTLLGDSTRTVNQQAQVYAAAGGPPQEVTLRYENWVYVMEPNVIEAGRPVRMTVDMKSVGGCMRDVVISSFGVRKYVSPGDNIIEFTPTRTGVFNIACSMNMGATTFTVVDAKGNTGEFKEAPIAAGSGSCGGSGGCGCGGGRTL